MSKYYSGERIKSGKEEFFSPGNRGMSSLTHLTYIFFSLRSKKGDGFSQFFWFRTLAKFPHQNTLTGPVLRSPDHNTWLDKDMKSSNFPKNGVMSPRLCVHPPLWTRKICALSNSLLFKWWHSPYPFHSVGAWKLWTRKGSKLFLHEKPRALRVSPQCEDCFSFPKCY